MAVYPFSGKILESLVDPVAVRTLTPERSAWRDLSLASGYPGLLLLFSTQKNCEAAAHSYVLKIRDAIESEGLFDLSLFNGVAGICFALKQASQDGTRYQKMLRTLHTYLLEQVEITLLQQLRQNASRDLPSSPRLYDPIQGVCGIGRYALENLLIPEFATLAENIVKALIPFSYPLRYKGKGIPGWYIPPTDALNMKHRSTYPKGNFNLGLAHGITGVLAFFAIAYLRGIQVEGQKDAMIAIANWIRYRSFIRNNTIMWPYSISWEEEIEGAPWRKEVSRDAWCYGVPGIARTLFLTGKALNNRELKNFAADAFRGVFQRSRNEWQLPGPTLCHGISGLFLITREMTKEEGCQDLLSHEAPLKELLLSDSDEGAIWGFSDRQMGSDGKTSAIDKPGFLEGAAGVLLSLLDESDPTWSLPLLIHA